MPFRCAFQDHLQFFLELVVPLSQESDEYRGLTADRLAEVLVLADRAVAACDQQQDNARVAEVADQLAAAVSGDQAEPLLGRLELWFKGLWWLVDPDGWRRAQAEGEAAVAKGKPNRFNLFAALVQLGLLTVEEANRSPDEYDEIPDPVRGLLLLAKEWRNAPVHDPRKPRRDQRDLRLQAAAVALVAPVFRHADGLRATLDRLLTTPLIDDPEADVNSEFQRLIQAIGSERRRHLEHFAGRGRWLGTIRKHLETGLRPAGGYLLLVAPEGTGKSAIVSRVSELLGTTGPVLGPYAETVRQLAPWLPGPVLHLGKQSNRPDEITRLLVAQANAMLLRPLDTRTAADPLADFGRLTAELPPRIRRRGGNAADAASGEGVDSLTRLPAAEDPAGRPERYHRLVFQALERLRDERGGAVLLVDALEEIGPDASRLGFLPPVLPPGVTGLLTVRPNTPAERWARRTLHNITPLKLDYLDREDIPLVTAVPDEGDGQAFNQEVYDRTSGVALAVRHIADEVRSAGGDHRRVGIDASLDLLFRRQADAWLAARPAGFTAGLGDVLCLLGVFEPVGWLSRGMIQGYLDSRGVEISSPELDDALQSVASQLEGLREDRVRLAVRAFARHVRTKVFSDRDIVRMIRQVGRWVTADPDAPPTPVGTFLRYWGGPKREQKFQKAVGDLVDALREARRFEILMAVADALRQPGQALAPVAEQAVRAAADAGHPPALARLGEWLLEGTRLPKNPDRGLTLLRQAAEAGEPSAMGSLADYFLNSRTDTSSREEGVRWLKAAAAAGHVGAMRVLGHRLIRGAVLPEDPAEGLRWLRKAIGKGSSVAMTVLGNVLLDRPELASSPDEGRTWLQKAADAGFPGGMRALGGRLLDGSGLPRSQTEGGQWLRRAAEAGDPEAMLDLGGRLIDGNGMPVDHVEGERWLRSAADAGDEAAARELGEFLLEGRRPAPDPVEGERWLRKAADAGDPMAMLYLAQRLLDADGLATNAEDGVRYLRQAAALRFPPAMSALGTRLIFGEIPASSPTEGEELLRAAIEARYGQAACNLGYFYYQTGRVEEARDLFLQSFRWGHEVAGINLAYILRRRELAATDGVPSLNELLARTLEEKDRFGFVNHALARAAGFQCVRDWEAADRIFDQMPRKPGDEELPKVAGWWHSLAQRGDPEGDLVLAWLARHGLASDPEGLALPERMARARRGPWADAPDWLDRPAAEGGLGKE